MSEKLTISQGLRRIKKLKGHIAEHQQRATAGVSYVDTKVPAFRFKDSVTAMKAAQSEMVSLEARIAAANATTTVTAGSESMPLAKAIRLLQELKGEITFLKGLGIRSEVVKERSQDWDDVKGSYVVRTVETKYMSDLSEQDRDIQVKEAQDLFEKLNNAVEGANHTVLI